MAPRRHNLGDKRGLTWALDNGSKDEFSDFGESVIGDGVWEVWGKERVWGVGSPSVWGVGGR
ncbi:hypothetical protein AM228_15940, partial [Planktothricoides sp. SR001]